MRQPRSRDQHTSRSTRPARELPAKQLARATGGVRVAMTDDGTTLTMTDDGTQLAAMTDRGDTYQ